MTQTQTKTVAPKTLALAPVRKSVLVKASQEHAFAVFAKIGWWPKTHSVFNPGKAQKEVILEPHVGGRWFERAEDGTERQWGKVLAWEPSGRMLLAWQLDAQHGFKASMQTEVEIRFIAEGPKATRVELEHRAFEGMGADAQAVHDSVGSPGGWNKVMDVFAAAFERAA